MVSVVYIILLPAWPILFVLRVVRNVLLTLLACVQSCIWAILSIPVALCCAAGARIRRIWNFSKYHARLLLTGKSAVAICEGTQTLGEDDREPPVLEDVEEDDEYVARTLTAVARGVRRRSGTGKQLSSVERRSLVAAIIKLLLQPSSPRDSDDEDEASALPVEQHGEAGRSLRLILDLMRLSNTRTDLPLEAQSRSRRPRDVSAMYQQVKEREWLQSLISELDHLATEVDPAVLLPERKSKPTTGPPPTSPAEDVPTPETLTETVEEEEEEEEEEGEREGERRDQDDVATSSDEQTQSDEEDREEVSRRPPASYQGMLSPVHECPELSARSTSEESVSQMESDLNTVLSRLNVEAGELEVLGQTLLVPGAQVEQPLPPPTVKTVAESSSGRDPSFPPPPPPSSTGMDPGTERSNGDSRLYSNVPTEEKFQGIPETPPILGVKVGNERRDLATARKKRPPTRWNSQPEPPEIDEEEPPVAVEKDSTVSPQSSELEEFEREEEEGGEDGSHEFRVWKMADQIQLLKPGPVGLEEQLGEEDDEEEEEETESEKKEEEPSPRPTAADEGKGEEEREEEKAVLVRGRVRLGGDLSLGTQPPWLEMRKPKLPPPLHPMPRESTPPPPPPPREPRTQDCPLSPTYDVLAPKRPPGGPPPPVPPRKPVAEPTYDCLMPQRPLPLVPPPLDVYDTVTQPRYLHEAVAVQRTSESEKTPDLPPRNPPRKSKSDEKKERLSRSRERRSSEDIKSRHKEKAASSKKGGATTSTSRSRSRDRSSSHSSRTSSERRLKPESKKSAASPSLPRKLFSSSASSPKDQGAKKRLPSREKDKESKSKSKGESPASRTSKAKGLKSTGRGPPSEKGTGEVSVYRSASKLSLTSGTLPLSPSEMKKSTSLTSLRRHGSLRGAESASGEGKQTTV